MDWIVTHAKEIIGAVAGLLGMWALWITKQVITLRSSQEVDDAVAQVNRQWVETHFDGLTSSIQELKKDSREANAKQQEQHQELARDIKGILTRLPPPKD